MSRLTFGYYPNPISPEKQKLEKKIFAYSLIIPAIFVIVIFLAEIVEQMLGISFTHFGVYPREAKGLIGILTYPLVHGDWGHVVGNATSFMVLSTALFFFYRHLAARIFIYNYLLAGVLLWFTGRESWHIGASGIIYGLAAFLFLSGVLRKDVRLLTIALVVTFLYGSFFWGLFPLKPGISWEGHLMGAVSGIFLAIAYRKQGPPRNKFEWEEEPDDDDDLDDENAYWKIDETKNDTHSESQAETEIPSKNQNSVFPGI